MILIQNPVQRGLIKDNRNLCCLVKQEIEDSSLTNTVPTLPYNDFESALRGSLDESYQMKSFSIPALQPSFINIEYSQVDVPQEVPFV